MKRIVIPPRTRHVIRLIYLVWFVCSIALIETLWKDAHTHTPQGKTGMQSFLLRVLVVDAQTEEPLDATIQISDFQTGEIPIVFRGLGTPTARIHNVFPEADRNEWKLYRLVTFHSVRLHVIKAGYETKIIDVNPSGLTVEKILVRLERVK